MAAGTKVQLRLGERVVAEVSFREDELRIGRMKENDLVINNLAVSRFHAVLRRVGDGFEIEDLGSENGTLVNGTPVKGRLALAPDAEITIGKHVLAVRSGAAAEPAARAPAAKNDAWDGGQTYLMSGAPAPAAAPPAEPAEAEAEVLSEALEEPESDAVPTPAPAPVAHETPDPTGLFAFGEDELALPPLPTLAEPAPERLAEFDVAAPEAAAPKSQTALFDFAATDDLGLSEPSFARVAAERAAATPAPEPVLPAAPAAAPEPAGDAAREPAGYAGLIVQRGGKVERVAPLEGPEIVAGRAPGCGLVLPTAGVSRRHARFVREGDAFRVFDLGSANGVIVNGERVSDRVLRVGDVVTIDDFTLTFVIDREPIDAAVRAAPKAPQPAHAAANVTVLHDAPLATMLEQDVLLAADEEPLVLDGEKELESVVEAAPLEADPGPVSDWVVEVVIAPEQLPPSLRAALRETGAAELRLPGEVRLRKR